MQTLISHTYENQVADLSYKQAQQVSIMFHFVSNPESN
jgi:hypothetical protein